MFETDKHLLYVEEFCGGGDLLTYVRKRRRLKEPVAKRVMRQILEGLYFCHSHNIVHRDIKLDNILLNSEGKVKICDFGVSKLVQPGERMAEQCGTPAYIAPEILRNKGYEGFGVDVWSAGIVLYAMIFGTVPFKASSMKELHKMIMRGRFAMKNDASPEVRHLIRRMLDPDPTRRCTVPEILSHKWFDDYDPTGISATSISCIVILFTEEEKAAIRAEFSRTQPRPRNEGLAGNSTTVESEWFTEHDLEASNNELTRNVSSKSNILAPFNTTFSHPSEEGSVEEDLVMPRRVVKLATKVRDIDRQYEKNNNCELDNGVYNKLMSESSKGGENGLSELNPFGEEEDGVEPEELNPAKRAEEDGDPLQPEETGKDFFRADKEAAEKARLDSIVQESLKIGIAHRG